MICGKLRQVGWTINPKRVYRLWKELGLKVPMKKRKKRRLGNSSNASHRRRAEHPNHVWSWDFIFDRTERGKLLKWLTIVDEFTRENLCLEVDYNMTSEDVINYLGELFHTRGCRNRFAATTGRSLSPGQFKIGLGNLDIETLYIEPGSPWENAFSESFNSRFRDEFLALEVFDNVSAAKRLTSSYRTNYNDHRPHSALDYQTPTEFARQCSVSVATLPQRNTAGKTEVNLNQPVLS